MRLAGLVEREARSDDRPELPGGEPLGQGRNQPVKSLPVPPLQHVEPEDPLVLVHQREALPPGDRRERHPREALDQRRHVSLLAGLHLGEAEHDQPPALAENPVGALEARRADRVHDDVDALAVRDPHHLVGEVDRVVVDRVVASLLADRVVLRRRGGPEDLGALGLADLDRRDPDSPRGRLDQHPIAGAEAADHHEAGVRGGVVDDDRGALLEAHRIRERQDLALGHAHELRVAAEASPGDHPVARLESGHPLTDGLDLARHLVADHRRQRRRIGIDARTRHQVGEVDPRRPDRDPDLPGADGRARAAPRPGGPRAPRAS